MMKKFLFFLLANLPMVLSAQMPAMKNVLYGAAFYEEYMPYDRLDRDVELMKQAGISVVRLGESTWSLFEPREGEFQFAWMDRIIDRLHKAGIKVILGTPTYSIPAWLAHKHPEVLAEYQGGSRAYYGIRQNMDITSPAYRFYAERIIRKMMEHYANHPAIIGYQVDNETTTYGANNRDFFLGFVDYMKDRYKSIEAVNKLWGLQYWGMTLNGWDEFPVRDGATSPSYKLEWERYKRKVIADYLTWQADIVREYKRPDQFITHCFMPAVFDLDQIASGRHLDMMSINVYHGSQDELTGEEIAFAGDYFRSVKQSNYLITETNAQTIGWDSKYQKPPYDGQLRMNVYAHLGSGANMVEYWHWHSLHYGQETYWKGVLSHDLEPNRAYNEVSRTAHELEKVGSHLVNLKKQNKIAILYSHDAAWGLQFMPFADGSHIYHNRLVLPMHKALYRMNAGVDFIFPGKSPFSNYSLVIIPSLYVAPDSLLVKIVDYVKNGGHVVLGFKSGFCNEYNAVRPVMMPGPLREACGFRYQEFSSISALPLKDNPFGVSEEDNKATDWCEFLIPETAEVVARYDHPFFGKYPAITTNRFGKGTVTYVGTNLTIPLYEALFRREIEKAGISDPAMKLHYPLIVKSGTNDLGRQVHYFFNYSSEPHQFAYPFARGNDLLTGTNYLRGQTVTMAPWDVLITEE
jgi:beta-galactosidase